MEVTNWGTLSTEIDGLTVTLRRAARTNNRKLAKVILSQIDDCLFEMWVESHTLRKESPMQTLVKGIRQGIEMKVGR